MKFRLTGQEGFPRYDITKWLVELGHPVVTQDEDWHLVMCRDAPLTVVGIVLDYGQCPGEARWLAYRKAGASTIFFGPTSKKSLFPILEALQNEVV